jgi:hypothetical protein
VAAASAAIAATAAAEATEAAAGSGQNGKPVREAKPKPASKSKGEPVETLMAASVTAAATEPLTLDALQPSRAGIIRFSRVRLQRHPGIIRAGSSPAVPEYHPPVEPLFSNEGIVRRSQENRRGAAERIAGAVAGVAAALAAAGTALGRALGRGPSGSIASPEATALDGAAIVADSESIQAPVSSVGVLDRIRNSRVVLALAGAAPAVRSGLVRARDTVIVPGAGIVVGAVLWPYHKLAGRAEPQLATVEAIDYPAERKRRRPIFWFLFGGFYAVLFAYILIAGLILPAVANEPATASPTAPVAYVNPTATATPIATPIATPTHKATATTIVITPSAAPIATPTHKATAAPTAKPTAAPTAKPTAVPTAPPTAVPTAPPTAVPTAPPTAVPTAPPTPVMFATITSATPPATAPGNGEFVVRSLAGASCYLTRSGGGHRTVQSPALTVGTNGYAPGFLWGARWTSSAWDNPSTLTFTATCTMPAPDSRTATSAPVTVQWPGIPAAT